MSVQDQGPGILIALMQQMQTFTTSKAETGGSGLGLGVEAVRFQNKGALRLLHGLVGIALSSCALPSAPA